jgi:hypothetical protein
MQRIFYAVAVGLILVGCSPRNGSEPPQGVSPQPSVAASSGRDDDALDAAEAVFRYMFERNSSSMKRNAAAYFLTIKNQDPSPEFLARFSENKPPVQAGSKFAKGSGLRFLVLSVEWKDDDTAEVTAGYYEGNLSGSQGVYRVIRKAGKWTVDGILKMMIS